MSSVVRKPFILNPINNWAERKREKREREREKERIIFPSYTGKCKKAVIVIGRYIKMLYTLQKFYILLFEFTFSNTNKENKNQSLLITLFLYSEK